jgi:hypothetical protein
VVKRFLIQLTKDSRIMIAKQTDGVGQLPNTGNALFGVRTITYQISQTPYTIDFACILEDGFQSRTISMNVRNYQYPH